MRHIQNLDRKILECIDTFTAQYGHAPSCRQLEKLLGSVSHSTICSHLKRMRDEGILTYQDSPADDEQYLTAGADPTRIKVSTSDGGCFMLDCSCKLDIDGSILFRLSGILDATGMRKKLCSIVRCTEEM